MPTPPTTVTLGGETIRLAPPKSYSTCYDLLLASQTNANRAFAAALGLCWQGPRKPKARYERSYSPLQYGGEVLDELVARRVSAADVQAAGIVAFGLASSVVVSAAVGSSRVDLQACKLEYSIVSPK